jgi:D-ribose pyranase
MKKGTLINQPISAVIAGLGHMDMLVIADAGLPIPATTQRIDLALTKGIPSFLQTLRVILSEMAVEQVIIAGELSATSPETLRAVRAALPHVQLETVSHDKFKEMTAGAKAVIRTGEFTPYANVILVAGVAF